MRGQKRIQCGGFIVVRLVVFFMDFLKLEKKEVIKNKEYLWVEREIFKVGCCNFQRNLRIRGFRIQMKIKIVYRRGNKCFGIIDIKIIFKII